MTSPLSSPPTYFGTPCGCVGHSGERFSDTHACVECARQEAEDQSRRRRKPLSRTERAALRVLGAA